VAVVVALIGLNAIGPYQAASPQALILDLLGVLVLEGMARQTSRRKDQAAPGTPAAELAVGCPVLGASWCLSLYLVVRSLGEVAFLRATPAQMAARLAADLPVVTAVAVARFAPRSWWMAGLALAYVALRMATSDRSIATFRRATEDLLWWGLLVWAAPYGVWSEMAAVVAMLFARSPSSSEGDTTESMARQITASESTLQEKERKFQEDKGRYREVLTLQGILDDFQGQALQCNELPALAREVVSAVSRMDQQCHAAVCRKTGEELSVVVGSKGFALADFQPLPRGWSAGRMIRSSDEERCFYALAGDLFFLMKATQPEAFERMEAFLEHLLARARLVLRILEQRQSLASLLAEKTAALDELADSQAALLQSEKLAAIGQLAAGVAHELNSPLAAIQLQTEMARRRLGKNDLDGVSRSLDVCEESGQVAKEIIQSLLAYSRVAGRGRSPVALDELVGQATRMVEGQLASAQVALRLQLAKLPPILVCAPEIVQILTNILTNATDALRQREIDRRILISSSAVDGGQQIVVANNGPPISAEVIERVFDPFFTTKAIGSGTGLGLSIAYQLARAHDGSLAVANADGWVQFRLLLPLASGPQGSAI
jgi:signal transduction histidine kinase